MESLYEIEKVYTVLELNEGIRIAIKSEFPRYIWVCGEIQDFRASRDKRHIYFSLVQKHAKQEAIVSKINAAIFESRKLKILKRLKESEDGFQLKDDIEVKVLCEVDLYSKTGNLSIIIVDIDPIYTLGKMAQSRQKIIEDLRKRGLLDKNKQKDIPDIPLNVGLITSLDSAAYHDFTNELKLSGYSFQVLAYNCHMQGNLVEKDVVAALKLFNDYSKDKLDVIVITRGGGSTADLSYFDNKKIAEAIAVSNFPVISALGHQINTTITDLTVHTFCKTPTKAAQFLVEKVKQVQDNLNFFQDQIIGKAEDILWTSKKSLQNITVKLDSASSRYFRFHREELLELRHGIFSNLKVLLSKEKAFINRCFDNLKLSVQNIVKNSKDYMCHVEQKTKILDPVNTLKRGYSITFKGKKSVKSIDDIQESDIITTVFYKGSITSKVMNKDKSE